MVWRIVQGARRRAGGAAVADHPAQYVPAPPAPHGAVGLRHGGRRRAGDRPRARRLSRREPTAGAGRSTCWCLSGCLASVGSSPAAARRHRGRPKSGSTGPASWRSAAAMAAMQLVLARGVRLDWFDSTRDHHRMPGRGARALHVHRALPDRQGAVPEPAAADRPQLCRRPSAGDDLRHAQLHARWCCSHRSCSTYAAFRRARRPGDRLPRPRDDRGLPDRRADQPPRPAHRHERRFSHAGGVRAVDADASTSTSPWTSWSGTA